MTRRVVTALFLLSVTSSCGGSSGDVHTETGEELWAYERLNLRPPGTWKELVEADPGLDTLRVVIVSPDLMGRMWRTLRVVKPGDEGQRLDLEPARIKVHPLSSGQVTRSGPLNPVVYLLDYTGDGFHWVGPHIVVPTGSELIVEASDWGDFQLEDGRLILHDEGVEFVAGEVGIPQRLCEAYAGLLDTPGIRECGPDAVRARTSEPE